MTDNPNPWLLLPVKSLRDGKDRLRAVLNDAERRRLNEQFLRRMLAVAQGYPSIDRVLVVSEGDDTLDLAGSLGAGTLKCCNKGLNSAVAEGYAVVGAPVLV